jgi:DNA repair protein RecN (Recombination protein N)
MELDRTGYNRIRASGSWELWATAMLCELAVQNLALIEDVRVELRPGFGAWTGETGAGKSLLLGALGLLLGERGSADLVRTGADELRVTGRFELLRPELHEEVERILGTPLEDDQLILSRRLSRAGRSYAYANDQPVALATLRALGEILVDIHGQRESHSLLQPAYQLRLLDGFGKLEPQRQHFADLADRVRSLRRQFRSLSEQRQQRQRELSLLRFERDELDQAALQPGEVTELQKERERLMHAQSLQAFAASGCGLLYDDEGSVAEQLGKLAREVHHWAAMDGALAEVARRLDTLTPEVRDVAETLRDLGQGYESDPARLEDVERRLQLLRRLEKKYGKSADELIAYRATLEEQETTLTRQEDDLATVESELATTYGQLKQAATELSKSRQKVAKKLASEAQKHLTELGMPDARLDAVLEQHPLADAADGDVPADGIDRLELMLAANRGEPALPLRKVASGGELSRTMLALKSVLAAHDPVCTLVFDEIDANIGGRLGDVLGQKLAALGQTHQVICVTHLPQVASYAGHQWTIRKTTRGKRTVTTIQRLEDGERLEELASMLRGEARGETTRKEAAAMLAAAKGRR